MPAHICHEEIDFIPCTFQLEISSNTKFSLFDEEQSKTHQQPNNWQNTKTLISPRPF